MMYTCKFACEIAVNNASVNVSTYTASVCVCSVHYMMSVEGGD